MISTILLCLYENSFKTVQTKTDFHLGNQREVCSCQE